MEFLGHWLKFSHCCISNQAPWQCVWEDHRRWSKFWEPCTHMTELQDASGPCIGLAQPWMLSSFEWSRCQDIFLLLLDLHNWAINMNFLTFFKIYTLCRRNLASFHFPFPWHFFFHEILKILRFIWRSLCFLPIYLFWPVPWLDFS